MYGSLTRVHKRKKKKKRHAYITLPPKDIAQNEILISICDFLVVYLNISLYEKMETLKQYAHCAGKCFLINV